MHGPVLNWQRPVDLAAANEKNSGLRRLGEIEQRDYRTYCMSQGLESDREESMRAFHAVWLLEPHRELDGEAPWVRMVKLSVEDLEPLSRRAIISSETGSLYECALDVFMRGDREQSRKRLDAVLAAKPDHALARRLLDRIEGKEPTSGGPRIIIPGS